MRCEIPIRLTVDMKSAIVNCVCPECGGAIDLSTDSFRCLGECGKHWRSVWNDAMSEQTQARRHQRRAGRR